MNYSRALILFITSPIIYICILIACQHRNTQVNLKLIHLNSIDLKIPKSLGQFTNTFEALIVNNSIYVVYLDLLNRIIIYDLFTSKLVDSILIQSEFQGKINGFHCIDLNNYLLFTEQNCIYYFSFGKINFLSKIEHTTSDFKFFIKSYNPAYCLKNKMTYIPLMTFSVDNRYDNYITGVILDSTMDISCYYKHYPMTYTMNNILPQGLISSSTVIENEIFISLPLLNNLIKLNNIGHMTFEINWIQNVEAKNKFNNNDINDQWLKTKKYGKLFYFAKFKYLGRVYSEPTEILQDNKIIYVPNDWIHFFNFGGKYVDAINLGKGSGYVFENSFSIDSILYLQKINLETEDLITYESFLLNVD